MKQVLIKQGKIIVEEVPPPIVIDNECLVKVHYSCISVGTELSALNTTSQSLFKTVLNQPEKVLKIVGILKNNGLRDTVNQVRNKLNTAIAIGYSASGKVLEVGSGVKDIKNGDRVACFGAGTANHAEFITAGRNLLVKVPDDLPLDVSSTVALGGIAMQAVRRAAPELGEISVIVGLGGLGQLIAQMLKANGCRVIGLDMNQRRVDIAVSLGTDRGVNAGRENVIEEVMKFSNGYGADSVIVTAATKSSEVINQAMEMCRKKGKLIIVGDVGLDLKREELYKKELNLLISTSYGPGRYEYKYENKGLDYPYAYVRWTENRNIECYLELLKNQRLNIKSLIEKVYSVEDAPLAYEAIKNEDNKPLMVLLKYDKDTKPTRKIVICSNKTLAGRINVGLIGAGNFARSIHLPNLKRLKEFYNIYAIANKTGSEAKDAAEQFQASYATSDFGEILKDKNIDMVIISTRHNLHAQMTIEAAKAGKAVFVEKPMALNEIELDEIIKVLQETKVPFMVGFNRRFSPYAEKIKEAVKNRLNPLIINYRMNAGFIPKEHWVQTEEGGGRNIGEACHIYDLFNFFTDSETESVTAHAIEPKTEQYVRNDNFIVTVKYQDGSVCNLVYTALGAKEVPKEQMDIYVDGKIIRLDDYKKMDVFGIRTKGLQTKISQKGHFEELAAFAKSVRENNGYPIALWQLIQATRISFEAEKKMI